MTLDKIIVKVWNKLMLKFKYKKDQQNQNITDKITRFEFYNIIIWFSRCYI